MVQIMSYQHVPNSVS